MFIYLFNIIFNQKFYFLNLWFYSHMNDYNGKEDVDPRRHLKKKKLQTKSKLAKLSNYTIGR